jgi:hypothetical protein
MHDTLFDDTFAEIRRRRGRLGNFMRNFNSCVKTAPSRKNVKTYVGGQVGSLERKNVENRDSSSETAMADADSL